MADINLPDFLPCQYNKPWQGKCGKPSTNGWCSEHEELRCVSCGEKATRGCSHAISLVCEATLCDACQHLNGTHVTKEVYAEKHRLKNEEEKAKIASRASFVQRMNEDLSVPLNLFELLKGDLSDYSLQHIYYLELTHGLMGFFPAVYNDEAEDIIATTDVMLLIELWKTLEPRKSKMNKITAYVDAAGEIAYPDKDSQREREESTPMELLTRERFERLSAAQEEPFRWAFGLIGADSSPEWFARIIEETSRDYRVAT